MNDIYMERWMIPVLNALDRIDANPALVDPENFLGISRFRVLSTFGRHLLLSSRSEHARR